MSENKNNTIDDNVYAILQGQNRQQRSKKVAQIRSWFKTVEKEIDNLRAMDSMQNRVMLQFYDEAHKLNKNELLLVYEKYKPSLNLIKNLR